MLFVLIRVFLGILSNFVDFFLNFVDFLETILFWKKIFFCKFYFFVENFFCKFYFFKNVCKILFRNLEMVQFVRPKVKMTAFLSFLSPKVEMTSFVAVRKCTWGFCSLSGMTFFKIKIEILFFKICICHVII